MTGVQTCALPICIPLHLLISGGKTRGLARRAFAPYLPREITARELKGQTTTYTLGFVRRGISFVRELLLDGLLVRERILSRSALDAILLNDEPMRAEAVFPLLACVAAETWARSWGQPRVAISHGAPQESPITGLVSGSMAAIRS